MLALADGAPQLQFAQVNKHPSEEKGNAFNHRLTCQTQTLGCLQWYSHCLVLHLLCSSPAELQVHLLGHSSHPVALEETDLFSSKTKDTAWIPVPSCPFLSQWP